MLSKKFFLIFTLSILSCPFLSHATITEEKISAIEQKESFNKFIDRVESKCKTAAKVVKVKEKTKNNGFMNNFFNKVIASSAKQQGYEGVEPEDAQTMQRFFLDDQNKVKALEIFNERSYNVDDINNTFELFKQNDRSLASLIRIQHAKTIEYFNLDVNTDKSTVCAMFHEKKDGCYAICDNEYQSIIIRGLIEEYIFVNDADLKE